MNSLPSKKPDDVATSPEAEKKRAISEGLRTLYKNVIEEPIPDDMLRLLSELGDGKK